MTSSAPFDLRAIAHQSLAILEPPYLKHYRGGRFRTWNGIALIGSSLPGPGFNFAAVLIPGTPPLAELIPIATEFFAEAGHGWGVLVEGDAGHPMEAELKARNWAVDEDEPAYVLPDLQSITALPSAELKIRQIGPDAGPYLELTNAAFECPADVAESMRPLPSYGSDPEIGLFVGSVSGRDVTAAGYSRSGPTAVLWGVATLPAYRGRGYGSAVSRAALAHAARRGCRQAALRSGPRSRPVYERLGFQYVCQHRTYAAPAVTSPVAPAASPVGLS
jgi:GNAT superfamily N-acetyltransferase